MDDLKEQVALVTGGSRGIGATIAERLAANGASVCLVARKVDELSDTADRIEASGGAVCAFPADVTNVDQVDAAVTAAETQFGAVDLLVNGAGRIGAIGPTWTVDPEEWWRDLSVNLLGVMLCCRRVLPDMIVRGRGRIVNMVGGGTDGPFEYGSAYGCSKAALMRFTETLSRELEGVPVHSFAVHPGFVRTRMTEQFLESEHGEKWMSGLADRLREGEDVSPKLAAQLVVEIAAGRCDELRGRYLYAPEDVGRLDDLKRETPEAPRGDRRTLRVV